MVGRLYLTNKQDAAEFSAGDQALVETFALHAAIAIDNARLYEQVQRLAVVDEQERISRELHDSIIQSIYAVTLSLDDVPELVREAPDDAQQRVDEAIDALHGVIRDIRNFIFGLRPLLLDSGSLIEGLQALGDEMRRNTATEVEIEGDEPSARWRSSRSCWPSPARRWRTSRVTRGRPRLDANRPADRRCASRSR